MPTHLTLGTQDATSDVDLIILIRRNRVAYVDRMHLCGLDTWA